jgi:hypothetical protein
MACMSHDCRICKAMWFDNQPSGECPKCGSYEVSSFFDEDPIWDTYRDDEDEDDDE